MSAGWLSYYKHVRQRLTIDRSFFKGARVVARLFAHYKFGAGKQKFAPGVPRPTLAFFPEPAGPWYNIWLVIQNTRLKIINSIQNADYIFIFDDSTSSNPIEELPQHVNATLINHRITDISKSNVSRIFKDVFGYDVHVDPVLFSGDAVEKSDENGTHDGRVVTCPIAQTAVNSGACYQKLIDSSFNGKTSEDLRIACVYGEVATVFHKHKALDKRFGTDYLSTDVRAAADLFSKTELTLIAEFCNQIGLDFGALDVMRDKHDKRIYIVDVNKTCMPVLTLPYPEQYRSFKLIADVLQRKLPPLI